MNNQFIKELLKPSEEDGKIQIPDWVKRVKIDVGTSLNAPNSEIWLNNDTDCCVFAFEPNKYNVRALETGENIGRHSRSIKLNPERFNKSFFCFNCALSDYISEGQQFYCAEDDSGTSSLFQPKNFEVMDITSVRVITLSSFFDLFPWERIQYIEQVKIDAQSSDFNVIKGIGSYLKERIVYLDVETSTNGQYHHDEDPDDIRHYMEEQGFECSSWGLDATFVNKSYKDILDKINHHRL